MSEHQTLASLRTQLNADGRALLDFVWGRGTARNFSEWPSTRETKLRFRLEDNEALLAAAPLGALIIPQGPVRESVTISFLGLLLMSRGEDCERLLTRYLVYLQDRVRKDPTTETITSTEVRTALELDSDNTQLLGQAIQLGRFYSAQAPGGGPTWIAGVPDDMPKYMLRSEWGVVIEQRALAERERIAQFVRANAPVPVPATKELPRSTSPFTPMAPEQSSEQHFRLAAANDSPAEWDALGFERYVQAVAEFLSAPGTEPPLTMSIEGPWGSGKTSFLRQLQRALIERGTARVVHFSAWHYEHERELWAAFALKVLAELRKIDQPWRKRLRASLRLLWLRIAQQGVPQTIASACFALAGIGMCVVLGVWFWSADVKQALSVFPESKALVDKLGLPDLTTWAGRGVGLLLSLTLAAKVLVYIRDRVGTPFNEVLTKVLRTPNYFGSLSAFEEFGRDFGKIADAYLPPGERLVVAIDDLDRCEVPRAVELFRMLSFLSEATPKVVFVLAMDRLAVATAIAVRQERVVALLPTAASEGPAGRSVHLAYGNSFIEKFVQVPFKLPTPSPGSMRGLVRQIAGESLREAFPPPPSRSKPSQQHGLSEGDYPAVSANELGPMTSAQQRITSAARIDLDLVSRATRPDSARVQRIAASVAPILGMNPRRVKQFVTMFRLHALIYASLAQELPSRSVPILEALGKFIAITTRWPDIIDDLERFPQLLGLLQGVALGEEPDALLQDTEAGIRWGQLSDLMEALRLGASGTDGDIAQWDLRQLDLNRLFSLAESIA